MKLKGISERIWAKNYLIVFLVLWTILIITSVLWNIYRNNEETKERALIEANTIFEHNLAYRRWNTQSGGVYVKVNENNQPNPYLVVPDRDLHTLEGETLTLVNPFRMTRQTYELLAKQSPLSAINRTVSLSPLNPYNEPDEWEKNALLLFEDKKLDHTSEITMINGEPYMRLLRTYMVEEGCLKCHAFQGYKVGDIRGGMSIAVPMKPYYETAAITWRVIISSHFILWILGTGIIILFSRGLKRYQINQKKLEDQLNQSRKMELLGHFASGVAHDFNNLLSAINGFSFLLQRNLKDKNGELLEYIKHINIASKLGKNLTSNLLAFGKKQIVKKEPLKLSKVINNISEVVKTLISEDIDMKVLLSEGESYVLADQHQIEQLIINLCTNAKDAMPAGGELKIQTNFIALDKEYNGALFTIPAGCYMMISVSDTGSGIEQKNLPHIFEPFFTTKKPGSGTGLGLAIVYNVVKEHNGFIDVISEPNKGTSFKVYLPIYKEPGSEISVEKATILEKQIEGNGETILVADDDATTRRFLDIFLRQKGYNVILAEDGADAIKKYNDNKDAIDMAILDVLLPKKNGKEVYNFIKSLNPNIKTLFMSGYTSDILTAKGIFDESLEFLHKPLDAQTFIARVHSILYKA